MEVDSLRIVEEGSWHEITAFCYRLSEALEPRIPPQRYERFEQWRPKPAEGTREVAARTNEQESLGETRLERDSGGMKEELSDAGRKMRDGGQDAVHGKARKTMQDVGEAGTATARGILPLLIRLVRGIERGIYTHIVGRTSPDFFESPDFTVSIEHKTMQGDHYRVQINFTDEDLGVEIADQLNEMRDIGDGVE